MRICVVEFGKGEMTLRNADFDWTGIHASQYRASGHRVHRTFLDRSHLTDFFPVPRRFPCRLMTSPPYWALRDYGVDGQLGLEPTPEEYIGKLCDVFDEVRRVLKADGSCWVNIGDCYGGHFGEPNGPKLSQGRNNGYKLAAQVKEGLPAKCLVQIPARFQIEMTNPGWILRNEIIWYKPNCMPSSAKDRFTIDFEKLFFFTKSRRYYFNTQYEPLAEASLARKEYGVKSNRYQYRSQGGLEMERMDGRFYNAEKGRVKRSVWRVPPRPFREAHFATFPPELCKIPIDAGCPPGGVVLDPFLGAGTTALVALEQGKDFVGVELNGDYIKIAEKRLAPYMPLIFVE